jgi:predicted transcriptional regulator
MSYGQLSKYLDELTELGFIEIRTAPFRAFLITPKGKQFHDMLSTKKRKPELQV